MVDWINQTLESGSFSFAVLGAAFLLGLVSSVAAACCSLPAVGINVGYSGTQRVNGFRANLNCAIFFMLGAIISLVILGSVAGFIGQVAQSSLGRYWKMFAGFVAILFGLAVLKLLPIKLPDRTSGNTRMPKGILPAALFGFLAGGGVSVLSMGCNPGIYIVLGVVVLNGYNLWAVSLLTAYAVGFSLPLAGVVAGVSFGTMAIKAKKVDTAIRMLAGTLLVGAGFYFLMTI